MNLIAFFGTFAFIYFTKNILMLLVLSIFLFFLLDPIVQKLESQGFSRRIISPLLIIIVMGLLSLGAWVAYLTTAEISFHIHEYADKVKHFFQYFADRAKIIAENSTLLLPQNEEPAQKVEVVRSMGDITSRVLQWLDAIVGIAGSIFMVPILTLFFLIERNRIQEKFTAFPFFAQTGSELAKKITQIVQGFFVGNLIGGLGSAVLFFPAFALIGLDNKIALAIGAGFLNIVPIVGAFLAMLFPLAQALLQFTTAAPFIVLIVLSLVVHFFIGNIVLPKLMGSRVDVNVTAATLGMLFWGWLWGAIGIFLAVPLMATIKVLCGLNPKTKPFEVLLSDETKYQSSLLLVNSLKSLRFRKTIPDGVDKPLG